MRLAAALRPARPAPERGRVGRVRLVGGLVLALLVGLTWFEAPWTERLQAAWFDAHQALAPRQVRGLPVTVVEIDQKSLAALGQWPWPRTKLARLVRALSAAHPAALGINILMPEADALSPERLLERELPLDASLIAALKTQQSNDAALARALAGAPSVLVVAGMPEATGMALRTTAVAVRGDPAALPLVQHAGALTNIAELDGAASGHGLISADPSRGVIRRIPLVASVGGTLVPTLAVEMLRVAQRASGLRLNAGRSGAAGSVTVGRLEIPVEADAGVRIYFSPRRADRLVSAIDVLEGRFERSMIEDRLVLVGLAGIGLLEYQDTPIGERMSGTEVHAQLLENLIDGTLLRRPQRAAQAEALLLLALGALLVWATPRWRPFSAALLMLACIAVPVLIAFVLFRGERLLFDAATPALGLMLLFLTLLVLTLAEAARYRHALEREVHDQREQGARMAGEIEAAQRVQNATLPRADLLAGDARIELAALLVPAREVGGDLYDYFMLDARRLFFLVGDVAGKGLSASIFMTVSKALAKSAMLRAPAADLGRIMSEADIEISRDNPDNLFVTLFAGVLDLDSGELEYCNAGHENPWLLHPGSADAPRRIVDGDGPPLCALSGFDYRSARIRLSRGAWLCLMTDGVAEAQNAAGELYGFGRLQDLLVRCQRERAGATAVVQAVEADVLAFAGGAEPSDDLTLLVLRWHGPAQTEAS
ncbi:MAG: CHASE2 domain-containing protein [Ideonella sp.]|nr:CHASE2 domain-containing protein [Ideonella sp.]